ncbi:MAG: hypothetical protein JWP03_351 [Phycisphaerales bacterium]|jgi:hypothetical protein|nr:hypothetical protein [Phycisphaerales bacterium]
MDTLHSPAGRPIFFGHRGIDRITLMCYDDGAMAIVRNDETAAQLWPPEEVEACMHAFLAALDRPEKLERHEPGPRANFECGMGPPSVGPSSVASVENATKSKEAPSEAPASSAIYSNPGNVDNLKKTLAAAPAAMRFSLMARIELEKKPPEPGPGAPVARRPARTKSTQTARPGAR